MPFTLTYNGNGSNGGSPPVDPHGPFNAGDRVQVQAPGSLTRTGATFAYWNTQADGGGTFHGFPQDTSFPMPAANVVLFAQWFVSSGLINGGVTAHYTFAYDSTLQAGGLEPGRTNALMLNVELDYGIMFRWFPGVKPAGPSPIPVFVTRLNGGANNNGSIRLKPNGNDVNELRSYLISEVTESFMDGQHKGWGFLPGVNNEESCGEALSLFLTQRFELSQRIAGPFTTFTANGWLNTSLDGSNSASTRFVTNPDGSVTDFGSRFDYVNSVLPFPGNGPGTGCSILFIYYLFHQLGFTIPQIIAAAPGFTNGVLNATAPLRGVYRNLTGDTSDPFPFFLGLLDTAFPPDQVSSIPGPIPDDPWPLTGTPLIITGVVTDTAGNPINDASIFLNAAFVIDPLFGNSLQLSTDSTGHYTTPVIRSGVYAISAAQELFVVGAASVTLLDKTLVQNFILDRTLPITITGQVTDTTGTPVDGATVSLIGPPQTTDTTGHYAIIGQLDPVPFDGNFSIDVRAAGFVSSSFSLFIPNGATVTQNVVLQKQGILTGHVTGEAGVRVGGIVVLGSLQIVTDATGLYSVTLNPGSYTGTVKAQGFTSDGFSVTIPIGTTVVRDFVLAKAVPGNIAGTVTDDGGTPIAAHVAVSGSPVATTDGNGRYTVTGLLPGPAHVTVSAGVRFLTQTATVTVVAAQTAEFDFALVLKNKL